MEGEKENGDRPKEYLSDEERRVRDLMRRREYYRKKCKESLAKSAGLDGPDKQKKQPTAREKAMAKLEAKLNERYKNRKERELERETKRRKPMTDKQREKVLAGLPESVRNHVAALEELKKAQTEPKRKQNNKNKE